MMKDFGKETIDNVEKSIQYTFSNKDLLIQSFIHRSYANEQNSLSLESYERLEYLGDAVLELIISDYFYHNYREFNEGQLTQLRAQVVNESTLVFLGKKANLDQYILLGKGEQKTEDRFRKSILADVMEAVIGATYLDGGIEVAKKVIYHLFHPVLEEDSSFIKNIINYKSILQEYWQKLHKNQDIFYEVYLEKGPENDKTFYVHCFCGKKCCGKGQGKSKKNAEQEAAKDALIHLGVF
ncbi:MAG: ribonuclease III [Tissierellia bacterium]|nr:ribonuclease III [Tissierellia bacterium]